MPVEGALPVAAGEAAPATVAETAVGTTSREAAPKPSKRNSIFGNFFAKSPAATPSTGEAAPAVPAKDLTAVSATAPQLEDPVIASSQPTAITHESAPGKLDTAVASTSATTSHKPTSPGSKGGLFGFMKQKEVQHEVKVFLLLTTTIS